MIARRLFIAFTGYKFLQNLHRLGFQTFSNVIDESYDFIENDNDRYAAAFEQVKQLCNKDQAEVYQLIRPMLEHNYNHIMTTDWTMFAAKQINQVLDQQLV